METLAFLLLVTMQRNNTGLVSISMGIFDYGYLVTTAFSQTGHINNTGVVRVSMGIFDYGYIVTTAFGQTRHRI
jgi:hypothetical protein